MATKPEHVSLGVAHTPLRDQVRDELRERIADGRLAPGVKMIERELADQLGVSRVPIREALRVLEAEGFVQVVPRRGVIVRQHSRIDIEELFDVREALEVLACRAAATRASVTEMALVRRTLTDGVRALNRGDREAALRSNEAFHDAVVGLAHNNLLAALLEPLQGRLHWLFRQVEDVAGVVREHEELFEAIASGDPNRAGQAALEHVQLNRQTALRLLFEHDQVSVGAS